MIQNLIPRMQTGGSDANPPTDLAASSIVGRTPRQGMRQAPSLTYPHSRRSLADRRYKQLQYTGVRYTRPRRVTQGLQDSLEKANSGA
jgi:hypothetical protein